jgi:hypothetical protein
MTYAGEIARRLMAVTIARGAFEGRRRTPPEGQAEVGGAILLAKAAT